MLRLELGADAHSPRLARTRVRELLTRLDVAPSIIEDTELLVTELVTNGVLHAKTSVTLEVEVQRDRIDVAVTDRSVRNLQRRSPSPDVATGRGINILDALAPDWTVSHHDEGKTVRFSLMADQLLGNVS